MSFPPWVDSILVHITRLSRNAFGLDAISILISIKALKSSWDKLKASATLLAFSCGIGPVTGMFLLLAFRNQSNKVFSISTLFPPLHRFFLLLTFASKSFIISSFFSRMLWIWILSHRTFPAAFLLPTWGFTSQNVITSKRVLNRALGVFVYLCQTKGRKTTFFRIQLSLCGYGN